MAVNSALDAFPPGTYTTTVSTDLRNEDGKFLHVILDIETAGTGTLTLKIRGRCRSRRAVNSPNGSHPLYDILLGTAVSSGTNVYRVGPGLTPAVNAVANDFVPVIWNIEVAMSNASAWVYSVQYSINA